jgi:Mn-dependent DtxR family transcriptional regulator
MQSAAYLVAIQLLDRGPQGRRRESVYRALDYSRSEVDEAIAALERAGVLMVAGRSVRASPAIVCLERLHLIAI